MSSVRYIDPAQVSLDQQTFLHSTHTFVDSAKKVANDILHPASSSSESSGCIGRVHVHHHHHDYWYSPFWGRPVYVVESRRSTKEENDRAFRFLVGCIATVVGAIAFFAVGANVGRCQEAEEELADIRSFKRDIRQFSATIQDRQCDSMTKLNHNILALKLHKIAAIKSSIFKRIKNNAVADLAGTVAIAAASVFAVTGAIVASYPLIVAGTVTGLTAGAAMLFKWGLNSTERHHQRDARDLLQTINELPK